MNNTQLYWIKDENLVWKKVIFKEINDKYIIFNDPEENKIIQILSDQKNIYLFRNNDKDDYCINLTNLIHLNSASILNNLNLRYNDNIIYTFNDNILLAINPYKNINIYDDKYIYKYKNNNENPHPYYIAQSSYNNLKKYNKNQSILVSGESGSGKTQTTKYIMNYLSSCNNNNNIEKKILASNPILEAFGNAKTIKNNNSSRFGKFIKLQFDKNYKLVGGNINIYLLEKIRVTSLNKFERNYHIFYIILKSLNIDEKNKLKLQDINIYNYINKSSVFNRDDNINDEDLYNEILESFKILDFNYDEIFDIFKIISFILNLGNIDNITDDNIFINNCIYLLNIDKNKFIDIFQNRYIYTSNDNIKIKNNKIEFLTIRDTIAQILYDSLFNYIVSKINNVISYNNEYYISILDIFGFEVFDNNGFEQLLINYTNEKLQNLFNNYIFKLEQKEYIKENIDWETINYPNNDNIISLIEQKNKSIFSLLTEQCILKSGTNKSYFDTLIKNFYNQNQNIISINKLDISKNKISINHYAGVVKYNVNNFVDKNKNIFNKKIFELFDSNYNENFILNKLNFNSINTTKKNNFITNQFKIELDSLIEEIQNTNQFYIRCIKPNDNNISDKFDRKRIYQQLNYCGILEAIKIARSGYPIRLLKEIFINEFYPIMNYYKIDISTSNIYIFINKFTHIDNKKYLYQIGTTKIFFKREFFETIQKKKKEILFTISTNIQKNIKRYIYKKKYTRLIKSIKILQIIWKNYIKKKNYSISLLKNKFYTFYIRTRYIDYKNNICKLQSFFRYIIQNSIYKNYLNKIHAVKIIENLFLIYKNKSIINKNLKNLIHLNKQNYNLKKELLELNENTDSDIKKQLEIELKNNYQYKISNDILNKKIIESENNYIISEQQKKINFDKIDCIRSEQNRIQANHELAEKMENLYIKLTLAHEKIEEQNKIILKYKNKNFFDFIRNIF